MDLSRLLKSFFESVETGVLITDRDGTTLLVNDAYCALTGYSKEELRGKTFSLGITAEQREEAMTTHKLLFAQEIKGTSSGKTSQHWQVQRKDGKHIAVVESSYVLQLATEERYLVTMVREVNQPRTDIQLTGLFPSAQDQVEEGVLFTNLSGTILYWNSGAAAFCNLHEQKASGRKIQDFFPHLDLQELKVQSNKGQEQLLLSNQYQQDSDTCIELKVHPFLNEKELAGFSFTLLNTRKKGRSKEYWQEQRNARDTLAKPKTNFLIRLDLNGVLTYANSAFLSSGIPAKDIHQKSFKEYIAPEDGQAWEEHLQKLLHSSFMQRLQLRMLRRNGSPCWVMWEFVPLYNNSEKATGLQGVGYYDNEQKNIGKERDELLLRLQAMNEELQANEEELRQNLERTVELNQYILKNERKFKSLLENSFEAVMVFDEPGYITYASPSVESTLGYSAEEMLNKKGIAFVHPDDKEQTRQLLGRVMEKPGNKVYILQRVMTKSGHYVWTESYTVNLLHDENIRGVVSNFRDVTERIQAEEKLRDSEATLNLAQHIANLGSAEFDLQSGKVKHSSGVFAIYDFDLDTFTEEEFNGFEYIHPEDAERASEFFNNYKPSGPEWIKGLAELSEEKIKEAETVSFEFRIVSAMGRLKYLKTKNRFIRNKDGKPVKSILTIQDISAEKERRHLLDETSRIARIGGWQLDLQTNTVSWTDQTYQLFEIPSTEELSVEKATQFYLPDYQPVLMDAFQKLVTEGTAFDLELKMATATKKEVWVRMLGQAEMVNNKVVLVKGTMQDITSRKNAEQEIRRYTQRLQLATEAAGIGIWDWDLHTNKMVWDQQMKELYGLPAGKDEVEFNDYKKALHPDEVQEQERLLKKVFKDKKLESEFRIISHSEVRWIKSYAKIIEDEEGQLRRMLGLNWDISRLKETEEMLRENNQELLKINHELDQFVYSTSHNLRAPLTSILGILNLIKNYPEGADIQTYLHLIEKSVVKLDETIQEISDYSRNTRVDVVLEPVNFEAIIEGVIESLSFLEQAEKINISYVTPDGFNFLSDSSRLKMIFTNLLSNAIKYACSEEKAPSIFIAVAEKEEGISISIKDNGIGIAQEHQEKIFSMFFRASSKSTGSGLGLYIVKEAVQKLGGTISVKSVLGKGTEFTIFLPNPG